MTEENKNKTQVLLKHSY